MRPMPWRTASAPLSMQSGEPTTMSIWHTRPDREQLNQNGQATLMERLDMRIEEIGDDFLVGSMPVDHRTVQIMGLLHGGASAALAETMGSIGANFCLNPATHAAVGIQITANHVRAARAGRVWGAAHPIHLGGSTQVWRIDVKDDLGHLVCHATLTVAVVERKRMRV